MPDAAGMCFGKKTGASWGCKLFLNCLNICYALSTLLIHITDYDFDIFCRNALIQFTDIYPYIALNWAQKAFMK